MSSKVYEIVTAKILEILDSGVVPWSVPWGPGVNEQKRSNGAAYRGFNQMLLTAERLVRGYSSRVWVTYKQAQEFGGTVKKGAKGTPVLFFQFMKKEEIRNGISREKKIPVTKFYTVFNIDQTEGCKLPAKLTSKPVAEHEPIDACKAIMDGYKNGPALVHLEHRAFYRPAPDEINMPAVDTFKSFAHYFGVWAHEAVHSTGHVKRLDRSTIGEAYHLDRSVRSFEEIIAELGSSYLCGVAGVEAVTIENSAAYCKSWLEYLRNDPGEIVRAASQAAKAADHILGVTFTKEEE